MLAPRTPFRRACAVVAALLVVGVASIGTVGAEPYSGSSTTSAPHRPTPRILLDRSNVTPGSVDRVRACGFDLGTSVRFTKDGDSLGVKDAVNSPPRGCDPPFDATENGNPYAELTFTIAPNDPAQHVVCAVAPGFPTACATLTVDGASVLALSTSRSGVSGSSSANPLAFTGFALLFWLAMALVGLFLGYVLVHWGRERRERGGMSS